MRDRTLAARDKLGAVRGRGETIAGLSGFVLLASLFMPWFSQSATVLLPTQTAISAQQGTFDAWQSFSSIDVILFLVAAMAFVAAFSAAPPALVVAVGGVVALLLIVFRLLDPPTPAFDVSVGTLDVGREFGILFALLAALGITVGSYKALVEA
jgi:hypothetical protein